MHSGRTPRHRPHPPRSPSWSPSSEPRSAPRPSLVVPSYGWPFRADAWIDVEHCLAAIHEAQSAVALRDWKRAWGPALQAQFIAHRPLLPEHDTPWLDNWRQRLDDVHDLALEAYSASCLGIGGTELPAAERAARRLLERSPLRETGYALLMNALAAQGNVAEAMRVYERARRTLDQELGITPGQAIQEAHARLLGLSATAP